MDTGVDINREGWGHLKGKDVDGIQTFIDPCREMHCFSINQSNLYSSHTVIHKSYGAVSTSLKQMLRLKTKTYGKY